MIDEENGAAAEQPAEAEDLRSVLMRSAEQVEKAHAEAEPKPAAEESAESTEAAAQRARDEKGRFAPKEGEAGDAEKAAEKPAGEPKPEAAPEAGKTETGDQAAVAQPATSVVEPPAHWSPADKEKFGALPLEAKQQFLDLSKRMEGWYTPKLQKLSQYERDFQGVLEIFAPHVEALRQRGQIPANVIQAWAGVEQGLLNHKAAVESGQNPGRNAAEQIARMIEGYKVDPAAIAEVLTAMRNGHMPASPQVAADPRVDQLSRQLQELTAAEQHRQSEAAQHRYSTVSQTLNSLANEKDAEGNLKRPFFAELEQDMGLFAQADIAAGKTPNPSELYDRAAWANPSTRERLLSLQKEQEVKRAAAEEKAKSERARKAGVSISGSPGATQARARPQGNRTLRQSIEEAAASLDA